MKRLSLTVPKPCSETWSNFAPTLNGGFCASCSKTVIDFTKMSDNEILDFFYNRAAHSCGRFRPDQLKTYSHRPPIHIHPGLKLVKAGFISMLLLLVGKPASAQTPSIKTKSETVHYQKYEASEKTPEKRRHIVKGVVIAEDNLPVPGVNVWLKGSTTGITTDAEGKFEFPQELKEGDILVFSFIGYDTQEYRIGNDAKEVVEIEMKFEYVTLMGEVVVGGAYMESTSGVSRWWRKLKGLF